MRRILLDFVSSLIFSVVGFLVFACIYNALESRLDIDFAGDKGKVFFGLFFGLPFGSILGILLIEKLIYKAQGWNILGIVLAALLSVVGNYLGIIMLDKIGGSVVILIPLLVVSVCVFGYSIVLLFK
jgi:hypothetical protein